MDILLIAALIFTRSLAFPADFHALQECKSKLESICRPLVGLEAALRCGWIKNKELNPECKAVTEFALQYYVLLLTEGGCKKSWLNTPAETASCAEFNKSRISIHEKMNTRAHKICGMDAEQAISVLNSAP